MSRHPTALAWLGTLVLALILPPAAPAQEAYVAGNDLKVVTEIGEAPRSLSFPAEAVTTFATSKDLILVGADRSQTPPGADSWPGLDLWAIDPAGESPRQLTFGRRVLGAHLEPDSQKIVYWTRAMRIFITDPDGRRTERIIDRGATPVLSPDGRLVAYARPPESWRPGDLPGTFDLHVYELASGSDRKLTGGFDDAAPLWTPDGRVILFLSGGRTGLTSLWALPAAGGEPRQLTNLGLTNADAQGFVPNPSRMASARWSPNGSSLVYEANYVETGEVVVLDFDAQWRVVAARTLGPGRYPSWSDSGQIFVPPVSTRPGRPLGTLLDPDAGESIEVGPDQTRDRAPTPLGAAATAPPASLACSTPLFRWPVASHPTGSYFYYDNNATAGAYKNWKCETTTGSYDGHKGTDIPVGCGTSIYSGAAGTVTTRVDGCPDYGFSGSTCGGGFGNHVKIDHGNGWISVYAHMKSGTPKALGAVGCGVVVGQSCGSGNTCCNGPNGSGPHLHFEVQKYAYPNNDPFSGSCSGAVSFWCNQNGDGTGKPSRTCCCS